MTVLDHARRYAAAGLSVFPVATDGSKSPLGSWAPYQSRIATDEEICRKFRGACGIAGIGGAVSGNREILDIDEPDLVEAFEAGVRELAPRLLERLPTVATPRNNHGGRHYHYRRKCQPAGNSKLAWSELRPQWNVDGSPQIDLSTGEQKLAPETMIETRGEGGYVLLPGSPGACHETGLEYEHVSGPPVEDAPIISDAEHAILWKVARSLNRYLRDDPGAGFNTKVPSTGTSPGDAFEQSATWESILGTAGWVLSHSRGEISYWRRPGKARGWSATTGCRSDGGRELLCVFSTNAHPFEGASGSKSCTTYGKFAAYATLNHRGDYSAAARTLAANGHGERTTRSALGHDGHQHSQGQIAARADAVRATGDEKRFAFERISTVELLDDSPAPVYLVDGLLADQQPGVIGGTYKVLKTSIACDMAVSLATATPFLRRFEVNRALRVGMFSGESGRHTLAETTSRIARAAGIDPREALGNLIWSMDVPKLTRLSHLEALEHFITSDELEFVFIDPYYLAMGEAGKVAPNLILMGTVFDPLTAISKRTGVTFCLLHHFSRGAARIRGFDPPDLGDLAYSGLAEFVRQWILLGRRATYEPGTGRHELWMTVGGSAGHSGLYALTIDEGRQDDFGGRRWAVSVENSDEARRAEAERRQSALDERHAETSSKRLEADKRALVQAMLKYPDGETKRILRDVAGLSGDRCTSAMAALLRAGDAVPCELFKGAKKSPLEGYRLADLAGPN